MSEVETVSSGVISLFGMLAIVFMTLKLTQIGPVATWSWWWVLSPIWIPFALSILILLVMVAIVGIYIK